MSHVEAISGPHMLVDLSQLRLGLLVSWAIFGEQLVLLHLLRSAL
jgi:hypothetical protein